MPQDSRPVSVAALYQFTRLDGLDALREMLLTGCNERGIKGTLLLAREGINGTIAGDVEALADVIALIRTLPGCEALDVKYSSAAAMPFKRMKVRIKAEIVTMGQPDIDPLADTGHYVSPHDWNTLIADPETIVIDTRNDYEITAGTFAGAINPETRSFREFPDWFRAQREALLAGRQAPRIAMFCTGGIRCEKSTAFLKSEGIDEVYHLKGGILKYLEDVPVSDSLWQGECFVFDERVTLGHGLTPGSFESCAGCGKPLVAGQRCADCAAP